MTYLYDVPICNFLGQPFQWLREIRNMETEDAETTSRVYSAGKAPLPRAPLTLLPTRVAQSEDDEDWCSPQCIHRWHQERVAELHGVVAEVSDVGSSAKGHFYGA